ncbi:MAG: hypothetical protein JW934_10315 [Anaerolineae bacterium]|nr:hypothetical protein [Anaerolineae bacterium]
MIVNRRTFVAKRGCLQEAAEMLNQEAEKMGLKSSFRLYVPEVAPFDVIAVEIEFENWEQYHKTWAEWSPGDAFWSKWYACTESGGVNEVWSLVK